MAHNAELVVDTTATTGPTGGLDVELKAGDKVGEYEIERKLGQGGFGAVFKATHPLIGKVAAIKVLSTQFSVNPEMVSRFVAEARAVNQIRHPNIIDIFSFGELPDGRQYYVMEYLDGDPLDVLIKKKQRLSLEEAIPILRGIARALDAAHAKGIAHRDLKAENVLLATTPEGDAWPKLLDFGIAKLSSDDQLRHKTRTGTPMGTPLYMSPEQSHGRDVDYRTDLYALGVLVYVMLTGVFPIDGEDYLTILMRQINDEPEPPSKHVKELPEAVDETVAWLMRKDPALRPSNAMTAVQALEGLIKAPPPRVATTANLLAQHAMPVTDVHELPPIRSNKVYVIVAGMIVAAIAAFFVVRALSQDAGRKVEPEPIVVQPTTADAAVDAAAAIVVVDAAPPAYFEIRIDGTPANTQVRLGTDLVGTAPGPVTLERFDAPSITLVLVADGYKPTSLTVTSDHLAYKATLVKQVRTKPPKHGSAGPTGPTGPTEEIDDFPPKQEE